MFSPPRPVSLLPFLASNPIYLSTQSRALTSWWSLCPANPLPPTHIQSHLSVRTHRTLETPEPNLFSLILSPVASNLSNAVSHPYLLTQPHTQPTHIYPPRQLVFTHHDHSRPNHTQNYHLVADWAPSRLRFLPIPVNIQLYSLTMYYQSLFHHGYHSRPTRTITGDHRTPVSTPLFDFSSFPSSRTRMCDSREFTNPPTILRRNLHLPPVVFPSHSAMY